MRQSRLGVSRDGRAGLNGELAMRAGNLEVMNVVEIKIAVMAQARLGGNRQIKGFERLLFAGNWLETEFVDAAVDGRCVGVARSMGNCPFHADFEARYRSMGSAPMVPRKYSM